MIFHTGNKFPRLGLVVTEGARELGEKLINTWYPGQKADLKRKIRF